MSNVIVINKAVAYVLSDGGYYCKPCADADGGLVTGKENLFSDHEPNPQLVIHCECCGKPLGNWRPVK